jgi:hypothetical protein
VSDNAFSFRWGVPALDGGFTDIPNLFLDYYTQAGVNRNEFLVIIHLARYQYNSRGSESRPSLDTVASQLDYTTRNLRKIFSGLEKRGLLKRNYRQGMTTIYDFSGFSRKLIEVARRAGEELDDRGEPQDRGTPEPQAPPPRNCRTSEEEKQEEHINNNGAGALNPERDRILELLRDFGIAEGVAEKLADSDNCSYDRVQAWIHYARTATGVNNPQGLVVDSLRNGYLPPEIPVSRASIPSGGEFS